MPGILSVAHVRVGGEGSGVAGGSLRSRRPLTPGVTYRSIRLSNRAAPPAGIINSEGRLWKSQRRFLHEKLREFGMTYMGNGKKIMEGRIKVCISYHFMTLFL